MIEDRQPDRRRPPFAGILRGARTAAGGGGGGGYDAGSYSGGGTDG